MVQNLKIDYFQLSSIKLTAVTCEYFAKGICVRILTIFKREDRTIFGLLNGGLKNKGVYSDTDIICNIHKSI